MMIYLVDKRTNFYYLGPKREVYLYENEGMIPASFQKKRHILIEYLSDQENLSFCTELFNHGIRILNYNGQKEAITADNIEYFDPNCIAYYFARYITQKKSEFKQKMWQEQVYTLVRVSDTKALCFATTTKDNERLLLGFTNYHTAQTFKEKKHLNDYMVARFPMVKENKYLLVGCNHTMILKEEQKK